MSFHGMKINYHWRLHIKRMFHTTNYLAPAGKNILINDLMPFWLQWGPCLFNTLSHDPNPMIFDEDGDD